MSSQSLLETIPPILRPLGIALIRTGAGKNSQFWGMNYGDLLTIRVQAASAALCWTITFKEGGEKSHPMILQKEGVPLQISTLEDFMRVKDVWVARIKAGC